MSPDPLDAKLDVNLRVADIDRSRQWYAKVFGTEPIYQGVDRSVDGVATAIVCFRLAGVKCWLYPRDPAAPQSHEPQLHEQQLHEQQSHGPQSIGLAFMTAQPLGPLRKELEARGASFDDSETPGFPIDEDGVRQGKDAEFIWMLDPDGHHLEFCRALALSKT